MTAAGSGLGEACDRRLSEDGYTPVLLSRSGSAVEVADELGGDGFEGSVTEPDDLAALVETTYERYGRIDDASKGIRMNAVQPGFADNYEIDEETKERIPMGRRGRTEEIADVAYLVSLCVELRHRTEHPRRRWPYGVGIANRRF